MALLTTMPTSEITPRSDGEAERLAGEQEPRHHPDGRQRHGHQHDADAAEGVELGEQEEEQQQHAQRHGAEDGLVGGARFFELAAELEADAGGQLEGRPGAARGCSKHPGRGYPLGELRQHLDVAGAVRDGRSPPAATRPPAGRAADSGTGRPPGAATSRVARSAAGKYSPADERTRMGIGSSPAFDTARSRLTEGTAAEHRRHVGAGQPVAPRLRVVDLEHYRRDAEAEVVAAVAGAGDAAQLAAGRRRPRSPGPRGSEPIDPHLDRGVDRRSLLEAAWRPPRPPAARGGRSLGPRRSAPRPRSRLEVATSQLSAVRD